MFDPMAYWVTIHESGGDGKKFILYCAELPARFAEAIANAKPVTSVARSIEAGDSGFAASLNPDVCRIVDMLQLPDNQALELEASVW